MGRSQWDERTTVLKFAGKKHAQRILIWWLALLLVFSMGLTGCMEHVGTKADKTTGQSQQSLDLKKIPAYDGAPYTEINDNKPTFTKRQLTTKEFKKYGDLDNQGRCTTAYANVSPKTLPNKRRGSIGMIKPTGWHTVRYDEIVDGKYLYNRCHLVAHELAGEDANEKNLITGTRYMNVQGMLPFENRVADYVKSTGNHVLYRVKPIFDGKDPLAKGVHMEAESVEDKGAGISFNIYCYNVQPGVHIDYHTGESYAKSGESKAGKTQTRGQKGYGAARKHTSSSKQETGARQEFVINQNTKKFHYADCPSARRILSKNRTTVKTTAEALIKQGYSPCQNCHPK